MNTDGSAASRPTYQNPVYPRSFPDPYILKFRGEYFAICTDFASDGNLFEMLHSRDLVHWRVLGGAMPPIASSPPLYWAPEITYYNGKFYLYYSTGNEVLMELRVAVSERPDGGYIDAGVKLTNEEFAIDAHVFVDDDGQRYMFYATDFLTHSHIGTGTVVDRMIDPFTLEGSPQPVTRAKFDWQVYDPNRQEKGGVRWHTVEGPFVLKRKGTYYEMFSGGNWKNVTYGVSFATADTVIRENEWEQFSDGENVLPILRTIPDRVIGPGHNSVVRGPNNVEEYCIYHRWTDHGRVLCIDRMDFAGGNRLFILGPTDSPQVAPFAPAVLDFFDRLDADVWTTISGDWIADENRLLSAASGHNEILCGRRTPAFICEFSLSAYGIDDGQYGFVLSKEGSVAFRFALDPGMRHAVSEWTERGTVVNSVLDLPADFDFNSYHLVRIKADSDRVSIVVDDSALRLTASVAEAFDEISLFADGSDAAFSGFALTPGFVDLFEETEGRLDGWEIVSGEEGIRESAAGLNVVSQEGESALVKKVPMGDFEFSVNFAIENSSAQRIGVGFGLAMDGRTPVWSLRRIDDRWSLHSSGSDEAIDLPAEYSPSDFHQIRFQQIAGNTKVYLEDALIGTFPALPNPGYVALKVEDAAVTFDMVRFISV